jgi:carbon storage regulator
VLVLTRKPGEQIVIANNIRITVVSIGPGRVKIGIEAPSNVKVDRQEVFEKRQAEQAAVSPPPAEEVAPPVVVNRIADKLPAEPPQLENRLKGIEDRFPPRKPR